MARDQRKQLQLDCAQLAQELARHEVGRQIAEEELCQLQAAYKVLCAESGEGSKQLKQHAEDYISHMADMDALGQKCDDLELKLNEARTQLLDSEQAKAAAQLTLEMTAKAAEAELTAAQEEQLCLEREKNQLLEQLTGSTPTDCDSCAELKTEVELQEKKVGELSGQVEQQSMQIEQLCEELEQQLTAAEENMLNLKEILKATCLERDELRTAAEEASQNGLAGAEPEAVVLSVQDLEFAVPAPMPPPCPYPEGSRKYKLFQVFIEFDLDNSGEILTEELLELGKARRKLGQKSGEWTEEKNAKLVKKIDVNGDGVITMSEFTDFFAEALPRNRGEFAEIVQQFMEVGGRLSVAQSSTQVCVQVAASLRVKKIERHEELMKVRRKKSGNLGHSKKSITVDLQKSQVEQTLRSNGLVQLVRNNGFTYGVAGE